ncbi:sigma-B regulation protein RsbU (phosphoserine phosphatase) [Maridesulfovibrio ferrireducens]|uniref:Sigma-B regulation protein RsbU (Phosphoserine phosphatase) n=1 Tax=Maridesulfovibrio ferrireducens TaxID=246191 RepID=A0A1G9KS24_9BACT|nr:SpoIIE family protein phosphatase [Maridesulfovibrio ferrireducens]SDL52521.1 sigma-B regulation protein RsbU (phosphoserine phosphatase) [Maridesulfovibrio ferrireducens]
MKIRFKLLLLLLAVSIIPLVIVQAGVLESLRSLSGEIGEEVRRELVNKSSVELKRLVEDHARVLSKQRRIVELNLQQLSAELSTWIEEGDQFLLPEIFIGVEELAEEDNSKRLQQKYKLQNSGMHGKGRIDFNSVGYSAGYQGKADRLLPQGSVNIISPLFKSIEKKNPDLTLWINAIFISGESLTYPARSKRMSMHQTVPVINGNLSPVWSLPQKDPVTGKTVLTASLGIIVRGKAVGSASIDIPLDTILHGYNHLGAFSDNIDSLLVRREGNTENSGIEVIAQQISSAGQNHMMHMWEPSAKQTLLSSTNTILFSRFKKFLADGKSGVMSMAYKGRDSIWAFSAPDKRGISLVLILPHDDVVEPAEKAKSFVNFTIGEQYKNTTYVLLAVVLLVSALAFLFSRRFTKNILTLAKGVKRIASGDFSAQVELSSSDEVGELAKDFNKMVPALQEHIEIKSALDVAMEVQTNLLPQTSPNIPTYEIFGESRYCDELGGDYFDYIMPHTDGESIRFAVGDVSGHGVPAAMLMGSIRGYVRARTLSGGTLGEVLTDVNKLVAEDTYKTGQFMTMIMVELDPDKNELRWVRAGHEPALIFDPGKDEFIKLEGQGIALGAIEEATYMENYCADLNAGQILILGTDGIWEASNEKGEFFGKQRLLEVIDSEKDSPAEVLVNSIFEAVHTFTGRDKQEDDLTVVVVKKINK